MPRVIIEFNAESHIYFVDLYKGEEIDDEYQVIVDLKSSHYRNIRRNDGRVQRDQTFLQNFFIRAQTLGRHIREQ